MSWIDRVQENFQTWAEAQRRLWDGVVEAVQSRGAGGADSLARFSRQAVDAWEASARRALDAQAQWARVWADAVQRAPGTPEALASQARQAQQLMVTWIEAQRDLMERWFEVARRLDLSDVAAASEQRVQQLVGAWQEAADRARRMQEEWTARLTGRQPTPAREAAEPAPPTPPPPAQALPTKKAAKKAAKRTTTKKTAATAKTTKTTKKATKKAAKKAT